MDIIKYEKFNNIFAVDCFDKEFEQLFDSSSYKRYAEWLRRNLHNLDTRGKNAVDGSHIEKLYKDGFIYIQSVIQGVKLTHVLSFILQQKTIT